MHLEHRRLSDARVAPKSGSRPGGLRGPLLANPSAGGRHRSRRWGMPVCPPRSCSAANSEWCTSHRHQGPCAPTRPSEHLERVRGVPVVPGSKGRTAGNDIERWCARPAAASRRSAPGFRGPGSPPDTREAPACEVGRPNFENVTTARRLRERARAPAAGSARRVGTGWIDAGLA